MKRVMNVLIALAVIAMFGVGTANAQLLSGSKHDLKTNAGALPGGRGQDLCRFCHAPHNTNNLVPLWDRNVSDSSGSFIVYSSPTMDHIMPQPGGVSNGCLSCHDGVTAFDALHGLAGTVGNDMNTLYPLNPSIVGLDLSNDHPIGVTVTGTTEMDTAANITGAGGIPLFGADNVECASCHDAHSVTYAFFLRKDPGVGDLCETCHLK
jgi:predicted CXXCH cytochrome family protein